MIVHSEQKQTSFDLFSQICPRQQLSVNNLCTIHAITHNNAFPLPLNLLMGDNICSLLNGFIISKKNKGPQDVYGTKEIQINFL